jgi:peptide/nickel transport system substrate-binding protein
MNRTLRSSVVTLVSAIAVVSGGWAASLSGREQPGSGAPPADSVDLLRAAPFDRVSLIDGTVLFVDPVSPRPLPPLDPKGGKRYSRDRGPLIPEEGNVIVGVPTKIVMPGDEKDPDKDGILIDEVKLHLMEGGPNEVRDFKVKRANIKKIEYFEDMLLEESDRLVTVHDYSRAFECCLRIQTRNPGWAGLADRVNHVLFAEGSRALLDGDGERGLRLLRELLLRKRDYPGLLDQIAEAYAKRVERALHLKLYARGRRVLRELAELAPEHSLVGQMRVLFISRATERVKQAEGASPPARVDLLVEALDIWPTLAGAADLYKKAFVAEPTLVVSVTDVAYPLGPWVRTPADARITRMLYRPILAADDDDARQGKRPGQLAAKIESSELGRRLVIRVRPDCLWSDGSRPVSNIDVARDLVDRTDPHSPRYLARWADLLDRVETPDETRVELRLNHPPLKAGAWLLGPLGAAHASIDGRVATSCHDRPLVSDGPFTCVAAGPDSVELRVRDDAPGSASNGEEDRPGGRIKRLREVRLAHGQSAVGALRRGEVSMIDHVPPDQAKGLAASPDIKVGNYTQPVVHVIAIDGRNPALRNRALRRGLSYAVDRKVLLEDHLLKREASDVDTVADGPFPKGSPADAPSVKPLAAHMWLAKMLVAAARKELNNSPIQLKLEYPAIAEVQAIVGKIAEAFRVAGVEIETVEVLPSKLERELRDGRRFDLAYRVLRCDEPILDAGVMLCPGYDAPPEADALASAASPRILQLLLQLERASDPSTARELAQQIDRESRDELPVIPLWQLVDHYAWRDRLKGPPSDAATLYQGIETWEIEPWFAKDPWDSK